MSTMTIAGLARAGEVGVETVRFYQRRGLLNEPARPAGAARGGGVRRYDAEDVRRLHFVRAAQAAGFSLAEIGELLHLDATRNREQVHAMAEARLERLDQQMADLRKARDWLAQLAHDCASGGRGPCPILRAFDNAS